MKVYSFFRLMLHAGELKRKNCTKSVHGKLIKWNNVGDIWDDSIALALMLNLFDSLNFNDI